MVTSVTFRGGGETVGSISDKKIEMAKQETAGGVGVHKNQESVFTVGDELKQDTVCFKSNMKTDEKMSKTETAFWLLGGAAFVFGLLGLAHKYDVVGKYIKNPKAQEFFRHTDVVTKPCHEACKWLKNNSYDKIVKFIKSKV